MFSIIKSITKLNNKNQLSQIRKKSSAVIKRIQSLTGDCEVVALVTGGAEGIGLACVKELFKNGVKAVTIADRDAKKGKALEKCLCSDGNLAKFIKTDVTDPEQLECAFQQTVDEFDGLNLVFNNAGVLNDKNWELTIDVNATHVVRSCFLAIKYMGKNNGHKGGIVINNASILGLQLFHGAPVYTATKHFVIGLTRSLGTPYYQCITNIDYMAICPGVTTTPLVEEAEKFALDVVGPQTAHEVVQGLADLPGQTVEDCAKSFIEIIDKGKNGECWISEGGATCQAIIPDRTTCSK